MMSQVRDVATRAGKITNVDMIHELFEGNAISANSGCLKQMTQIVDHTLGI